MAGGSPDNMTYVQRALQPPGLSTCELPGAEEEGGETGKPFWQLKGSRLYWGLETAQFHPPVPRLLTTCIPGFAREAMRQRPLKNKIKGLAPF